MKLLVAFFFIVFVSSLRAETIKMATLNIRWFGLGGEISGLKTDEYRGKWIKEYIQSKLYDNDGIMFQEIVDKKPLYKLMKDLGFNCYSYDNNYRSHQHVVFCLKNKYEFLSERDIKGYAYTPVASVNGSKLRPALVGVIRDHYRNKNLLRVVGVHLKARGSHSFTRLKQMYLIKKFIAERKDNLPVMILGDFNTHNSEDTGQRKDDLEMLKDAVDDLHIKWVYNPYNSTFKVPEISFKLDHFFVSDSIRIKNLDVLGACNKESRGERFDDISFWNRFISDHCPVMVEAEL